ncbi:hypothetical protein SprV_0702249800 [Sparganum proliferum]
MREMPQYLVPLAVSFCLLGLFVVYFAVQISLNYRRLKRVRPLTWCRCGCVNSIRLIDTLTPRDRSYATRNSSMVIPPPLCTTSKRSLFFASKYAFLWNNLPPEISGLLTVGRQLIADIRRLMTRQLLSLWLRRLRQPAGCRRAWPSGLSTRTFEGTTAFHRRGFSYVTTTIGTTFAFALSWPFSRREPSLEERIKEQMHSAFLHIKNGRLEDADTALHALLLTLDEATRTGQQTNDEWLSRRARVYSELANLKLLQQDYAAAERLFVHTIRDCTASGVPPGSPAIIELSLKLAMVYSKLADSEKAESGFAFCLMMQQQNCSAIPLDDDGGKPLSEEDLNNLALLGAVQNAYAHYEVLQGRLPAGRKLLEAALKTARRVYTPNHLNCVHLLADLANVESQLDMPKNARSRLKEAVSLVLSATAAASKREKQESDVALFNLYCQWAVLEGNQGAFKTAKKYLTEAKLLCANLPADADNQRRYKKQISKVETMLQRWQSMEANCEELLVSSDEP